MTPRRPPPRPICRARKRCRRGLRRAPSRRRRGSGWRPCQARRRCRRPLPGRSDSRVEKVVGNVACRDVVAGRDAGPPCGSARASSANAWATGSAVGLEADGNGRALECARHGVRRPRVAVRRVCARDTPGRAPLYPRPRHFTSAQRVSNPVRAPGGASPFAPSIRIHWQVNVLGERPGSAMVPFTAVTLDAGLRVCRRRDRGPGHHRLRLKRHLHAVPLPTPPLHAVTAGTNAESSATGTL